MQQPKPIDLSALKGILNKSKKLMTTVESGNYETGQIDSSMMNQGHQLVESLPNGQPPKMGQNVSQHKAQYNETMVKNSNLPESIKKAMLEQPIEQINSPNHTFNLEDMVDKPVPPPSAPQTKRVVRETIQQPIDVTEERMRSIVKEELANFFSQYFMREITEKIQRQTIKNLMENGIIKKKTVIKK